MKRYEIMKGKALALAVVLMAGIAGGCSQTEIAMEPADPSYILTTTIQKGYLTDENSQRGYLTSEVRESGNGSVTLYLRATKPEQGASEVTLSYAPELVEAYNEETGNEYTALPETQLTLPTGNMTLEAGQQTSAAAQVSYTLTAEQTAGNTYVIPLRAEVVSGPMEINAEDAEYLIFLNVTENPGDCSKGDDKSKVFCVMETNDANPLNLLSFTLENSGKYLFDALVLFSDNIVLDKTTNTVHALVNEPIKYILNNREKYLKPLQDRGMKIILGITPYHTHAGVANLMPATAEAFAKELKIICDTYSLDGIFFDDEYTVLETPTPTGFYSELSAEAGADLMYRVKRLMPDRMVVAYCLGSLKNMSSEGCTIVDNGVSYQPGDYIDYVMVDYGELDPVSPDFYPGLPESRFGMHSYNFNRDSPNWPTVTDLEEVRDTYKTLFIYGLNPYHSSGSFNTTPVGNREQMTQVQALNRVSETLFGEQMVFDGTTYPKEW